MGWDGMGWEEHKHKQGDDDTLPNPCRNLDLIPWCKWMGWDGMGGTHGMGWEAHKHTSRAMTTPCPIHVEISISFLGANGWGGMGWEAHMGWDGRHTNTQAGR